MDALVEFLQRYAESERYGLDRSTIQYLAERLGGDMELIVSEMEKLYLHAGAAERRRTTGRHRAPEHRNPWPPSSTCWTTWPWPAGRPSAHARLTTLLDGGEHPLGILACSTGSSSRWPCTRACGTRGRPKEILSHMRLQAFQLKNIERAHCNYSAEEAWHCLSLIGQAEEEFKSIRVNPAITWNSCCCGCAPRPRPRTGHGDPDEFARRLKDSLRFSNLDEAEASVRAIDSLFRQRRRSGRPGRHPSVPSPAERGIRRARRLAGMSDFHQPNEGKKKRSPGGFNSGLRDPTCFSTGCRPTPGHRRVPRSAG